MENFRELNDSELSQVSGGDILVYSDQYAETEYGDPLFHNWWIDTNGGNIVKETWSGTNEYLRELEFQQSIENSTNQNNSNNNFNIPEPPEIDYQAYNQNYYNYNYYDYYIDNLPRTFNGQPIDFIGVGTSGGELAYA